MGFVDFPHKFYEMPAVIVGGEFIQVRPVIVPILFVQSCLCMIIDQLNIS